MANLYRPGNHAGAVLVALGTGVMFTLSVFLVQRSMLSQMLESAPPDMPNVFLVNITEAERAGLAELISRQPGVLQPPVVIASAEARMTADQRRGRGKAAGRRQGRRRATTTASSTGRAA